jgi:hypothetical protein
MKEDSRLRLTVRNHATRSDPGEFKVIEIPLDPDFKAIIDQFAAELDLSPDEFGSLAWEFFRGRQN